MALTLTLEAAPAERELEDREQALYRTLSRLGGPAADSVLFELDDVNGLLLVEREDAMARRVALALFSLGLGAHWRIVYSAMFAHLEYVDGDELEYIPAPAGGAISG